MLNDTFWETETKKNVKRKHAKSGEQGTYELVLPVNTGTRDTLQGSLRLILRV